MHVISAKAVAFAEALKPEFKTYIKNVVLNAQTLAKVMVDRGAQIVSGGTDNHLMLVDLRPKKLTGKAAEYSLEQSGITCNKNGVPFDPEKPFITSGIRLGTPAATTRGFGVEEFKLVGEYIGDVLDTLVRILTIIAKKKKKSCQKYKSYVRSFLYMIILFRLED